MYNSVIAVGNDEFLGAMRGRAGRSCGEREHPRVRPRVLSVSEKRGAVPYCEAKARPNERDRFNIGMKD